MFDLEKNSLSFDVKDRNFSKQDKGISPLGASDQFSFKIAKLLLNEPEKFSCKEIIYTSKIFFTKDCVFTLTGAYYKNMFIHSRTLKTPLNHSTVYQAKKDDFISIDTLVKGFRLYIMASLDKKSLKYIGKSRGVFEDSFTPIHPKIRLIKGIEYSYLKEPDLFFKQKFKVSRLSDLIGIRLESKKIKATQYDIISSSVDDGTIQLTKDGIIALLRHRQTTGGYPRIFSIINVDIDILAQYKVGETLEFELIDIKEAKLLLLKRENELKKFKITLAS